MAISTEFLFSSSSSSSTIFQLGMLVPTYSAGGAGGGWQAQGPRVRCGGARVRGLAEVARLGGCSGPLAGSNVDGDCDFQHMAAVPCICKREAVG